VRHKERKVLVLWGEGWHEGVLGIVASRLVDTWGRPAIILTLKGEEARGSARSIPGFNIAEALERCSDVLIRSGGHSRAAGLSLHKDNLAAFEELINAVAEETNHGKVERQPLLIDASLPLAEATLQLLEEVEGLAPFGEGNPEPVFLAEGAKPSDVRRVGADRSHLVFNLSSPGENALRRCVAFNAGFLELQEGCPVSVCFHLRRDDYGNGVYPQLEVVDLQAGDAPRDSSLPSE
jgi:single-stranded-DNA-specific exonuclease